MFLPYPSSATSRSRPVIETIRSLLLGTPAGTKPVQAVAWCCAILVASAALAGVLFRRRTA